MRAQTYLVRLFVDGEQWCAQLGEEQVVNAFGGDLEQSVAGFSNTASGALRDLVSCI